MGIIISVDTSGEIVRIGVTAANAERECYVSHGSGLKQQTRCKVWITETWGQACCVFNIYGKFSLRNMRIELFSLNRKLIHSIADQSLCNEYKCRRQILPTGATFSDLRPPSDAWHVMRDAWHFTWHVTILVLSSDSQVSLSPRVTNALSCKLWIHASLRV